MSSNTKALPESEDVSFTFSLLVWRLSMTTSWEGNDGPARKRTRRMPPEYMGNKDRVVWSLEW